MNWVKRVFKAFKQSIDDSNTLVWEQAKFEASIKNPWFTNDAINTCIKTWQLSLNEEETDAFEKSYTWTEKEGKKLGLILAGNIPMVGMHDILMGLLCKYELCIKPSSLDTILIQTWIKSAIQIEPEIEKYINYIEKMPKIDALIVTGSDQAARTFEYYFNDTNKLIRGSRNSVAILTGKETMQELTLLGLDIFTYFGLGCRNVTHLLVPINYNFTTMIEAWDSFKDIINHNKYANNYTYHRALLLMNLDPHIDFGFGMLHLSTSLYSPVSLTHYQFYENDNDLMKILDGMESKLQCKIGHNYLPFGQAQTPMLKDFADGVDTLAFLLA